MAATARKTNEPLWNRVKASVTRSDKGGKPGQWSARKAQLAVAEYKKKGGGYAGPKAGDNHLTQWGDEKWGTKSGRASLKSGERYLPKRAREAMSGTDYAATTRKKRADLAAGKQFSSQPAAARRTTAATKGRTAPAARAGGGRLDGLTRLELMQRAAREGIAGRSRMRKDELLSALRG